MPVPRYSPLLGEKKRLEPEGPVRQGFEIGNSDDVLDALIRHSSDCVALLDLDGYVLRWNASCEDLFGWNSHEILGRRLPHVYEPQRLSWISQLRAVASGNEIVETEGYGIRSDGSRVSIDMSLIPVHDQDGHTAAILSITREVGKDSRHERHRDDFVEVMSRELHDPLTAVLGFAQLLQHPAIMDDAERRGRTVRALVDRAEQMSSLLDDLQVVFELESGDLALAIEQVDPAAAVTDAVGTVRGAESRVLVDFEQGLGTIPADRRRLAQAVATLVSNALRHTPQDASVGVSVYGTSSEIVIEVADMGPGIEQADRERIFDRFYSGATRDGGREGLGIGLFLARVIAEAHGGAITVASLPAAGSTFTLRLPRTATQLESEATS
jgi:PAS domain S-box-containing protein